MFFAIYLKYTPLCDFEYYYLTEVNIFWPIEIILNHCELQHAIEPQKFRNLKSADRPEVQTSLFFNEIWTVIVSAKARIEAGRPRTKP